MQKARCNICGVPESCWVDGKCCRCGNRRHCDMTSDMVVEQRIFDWCDKHGMLYCGAISKDSVRSEVKKMLAAGKKIPKYIFQYVEG